MSTVSRKDWEDALYELAVKASNKWLDEMSTKPTDVAVDENGAIRVRDKVFDRLLDKYKYGSFNKYQLDEVNNLDPSKTWKWVLNDYPDPSIAVKEAKAKDFLPLVAQHAEPDSSWYDRSAQNLKLRASEPPFNYPYTKEGFAEFLGEMAKQQEQADRADVVAEMREQKLGIPGTGIEFGPRGSAYWLGTVASPSATEAIENAVVNGDNLSATDAALLSGIDYLSNVAEWEMPSVNVVKNPVVNASIGAALQGAAELGRQFGKTAVNDSLVVDPNAAIFAAGAGATKPVLVRGAQGIVTQVPGAGPAQFSRGIMKSMKAGDPMDVERRNLEKVFRGYNKHVDERKKAAEYLKNAVDNGVTFSDDQLMEIYEIAKGNKLDALKSVPEKARLLGVKKDPVTGKFDVDEVLREYDKRPLRGYRYDENGMPVRVDNVAKIVEKDPSSYYGSGFKEGARYLGPEEEAAFAAQFPARITNEADKSGARTAGILTGGFLGGLGSKVEPTFKIYKWGMPPKSKSYEEYKDTPWYQAMDEDKRKLFDKAFKDVKKKDVKSGTTGPSTKSILGTAADYIDTGRMLLSATHPAVAVGEDLRKSSDELAKDIANSRGSAFATRFPLYWIARGGNYLHAADLLRELDRRLNGNKE